MNRHHSTTPGGQISSPLNLKAKIGKDNTSRPLDRFVAAYTSRAFRDYIKPARDVTSRDLRTACQFVHSPEGRDLIAFTSGQPLHRVRQTLETFTPEWEAAA